MTFALLPEGQDPDDLARSGGSRAVTEVLDRALEGGLNLGRNALDYLLSETAHKAGQMALSLGFHIVLSCFGVALPVAVAASWSTTCWKCACTAAIGSPWL